MLGTRSKLETAVGSWPNWNTTNTSTTKTATETIAVRERNSTSRSFDATAHAWRSRSGDRIAIILRHLRRPARAAWREMHEAAGAHECDLGRESRSFFHVVGHQHRRAARRSEEHTSELQSRRDLVCRLLLEKKKKNNNI